MASDSPRRPLHVLSLSPPHLNGYSIRTHSILTAQLRAGRTPAGVTSPYYPLECLNQREPYTVDGITYYRVPNRRYLAKRRPDEAGPIASVGETMADRSRYPWIPNAVFQCMTAARSIPEAATYFRPRILEIARQERSDLVHAHTPFRNAYPAWMAARKLRIPFVYEMRGLWEDTAVEAGKFIEGNWIYRAFRRMETEILRRADAVLCISDALAADVGDRGIPRRKIFVAPNGVAADFHSRPDSGGAVELSVSIRSRLNLDETSVVIGYVGSIRKLEGIHFLVKAFPAIARRYPQARLLIVGGGDEKYAIRLQRIIDEAGLGEKAVLFGPVPNDEVAAAYRLIDVFAITRLGRRVTRLVTPLKPYEAMAMGKAVMLPDLPAMAEIVRDGETGVIFETRNSRDFIRKAGALIENSERRRQIGESAARSVRKERTWDHTAQAIQAAYDFAVSASHR